MAIVDVVKYNGSPDVFAWKYPDEALGTWTQLVVNDAQEAILFKGGRALDVFGGGRHTLSTANIPLLNKIINLPFGGRSPFTAEVWYVNKLHTLDIKWGTPSPIQLQDPKYGIFAPVRSYGHFGIQIENSRKFIAKLVGTLADFTRTDLVKFFRGLFVTKAKDSISSYLIHKKISILEVNAYLDELSHYIRERIAPVLEDYGITLLNFYVNDINIPESDPALVQLKNALSKRAEMNIIGYNYRQERTFDTLEGAATNPGTGASTLMGAGLGLGMGVGMGGAVGGQFGELSRAMNLRPSSVDVCSRCTASLPEASRFCPACGHSGADAPQPSEDVPCDKCGAALRKGAKFCSECGDIYNPCSKCGTDLPEGTTHCGHCGHASTARCPSCREPIPVPGAKFCPLCGEALVKKCPSCNEVLPETAKFCPACGAKCARES